jgi:uncharacterized protein YndB with AHSA1/START domain
VARNETFIDAPPRAVFELLSDPRTYGHWVVGSREIRAADESWPEAGSKFDHSVGVTPLVNHDHTEVLRSCPPVMLELRARSRPFPTARVTIHLQPEREGTRVTLIEEPASRLLNVLSGPVGHAAVRLRNVESLRRLKELAEGATARPTDPLPPRAAA